MDFEDTEAFIEPLLFHLISSYILQDSHESRLFKLLSETDIQVYNKLNTVNISWEVTDKIELQESGLKTCDSRDIVVSDIFVKVINILETFFCFSLLIF